MNEVDREVLWIKDIKPTRESDPDRVRDLTLSIRVVGAVRRVPVSWPTRHVVQGHNRLQALRDLGYKKVPIVWVAERDVKATKSSTGSPAQNGPREEARARESTVKREDDIQHALDFVSTRSLCVRTLCVGVFDLFHFGHVNLLRGAALLGDHLTVGVQYNVTKRKDQVPAYTFDERVFYVRSLRFVDEVIPYEDVDLLVESELPDVFAHGPDQVHDGFKRACAFCEQRGIRVVEVPRTQGVSSSELRRMMETHR